MNRYVFHKVTFTIGKEYKEEDTFPLKYYYVLCQWHNALGEVFYVKTIAEAEDIKSALNGDKDARYEIFICFAYYLMLSYKIKL